MMAFACYCLEHDVARDSTPKKAKKIKSSTLGWYMTELGFHLQELHQIDIMISTTDHHLHRAHS